jgi:hypothetical protein
MKFELPTKVKVFDVVYKIEHLDKPSEVDLFKRESLWGQVDFWTRTIRIYHNNRQVADVMQTVWHEILHAIASSLHIDNKINDDNDIIDLLATGINNVIVDNDWMKYDLD